MANDLNEQLTKCLTDAHSIEEQALAQLRTAPEIAGDPELASIYTDHAAETRDHAELVQERLTALGGDPSTLKDAAMRLGGLNWSAFFQGHPDTPGKLAAFAYAFEHLEVGGYEQLRRVAERAGDQETARLAERILEQEREAAARIAGAFDRAARASLEAVIAGG
jgi:ferritin-like metal-binding protein YciE